MKIFESFNISFAKVTSIAVLNKTLKNNLQQKHPIHKLLKKLNSLELNDITNKIGVTYNKRLNKMRGALAKYFFINHSSSPLTSLKKCLMAPTVKDPQPKIDKNHPIFEFLKNVSDNEVKEWTKKSW